VDVDVAITNVFAGHHVPTDYPGRNMILLVRATDGEGHALAQVEGGTVPVWGGAGGTATDYAGQPGKGFAKVLRDARTGAWPVVSYWKQAFVLSDNRIPANATDLSHYAFALPPGDAGTSAHVEAVLWFRRLFIDQARAKGWDSPDILMARGQAELSSAGWEAQQALHK